MADVYFREMFLLVWLKRRGNSHLGCLEAGWCWRKRSKSKRWRGQRGPKIGPDIIGDLGMPQFLYMNTKRINWKQIPKEVSRFVLLNCEHNHSMLVFHIIDVSFDSDRYPVINNIFNQLFCNGQWPRIQYKLKIMFTMKPDPNRAFKGWLVFTTHDSFDDMFHHLTCCCTWHWMAKHKYLSGSLLEKT